MSIPKDSLSLPRWLGTAPPRFSMDDTISGLYKVTHVKHNGRRYQLLLVTGIQKSSYQRVHVAKVIPRADCRTKAFNAHLQWLRSLVTFDVSSTLLMDFYDDEYCYLIFHRNTFNLKDVMTHGVIPLSSAHIREIALQLIRALQSGSATVLSREAKSHGDLCPENVEFLDVLCTNHDSYDLETGSSMTTTVISSTKIRLAYYGDLGLRDGQRRRMKQHRS
ncbi:hypothetical protein D9619_010533 [Psilocybe cf. subviscida]|uniref:Protein kinase domain-containing protein n=1 Tax=Psilocybe cf. subviscida TaxID=2480587 RepID=A0A8H5ASI1_9AGAR|nr:hypothetical protein D9619_010533 [Psilocybe cf. subviscida]